MNPNTFVAITPLTFCMDQRGGFLVRVRRGVPRVWVESREAALGVIDRLWTDAQRDRMLPELSVRGVA
jgi:hypothetical protein